jgi:hypothetical protein
MTGFEVAETSPIGAKLSAFYLRIHSIGVIALPRLDRGIDRAIQ